MSSVRVRFEVSISLEEFNQLWRRHGVDVKDLEDHIRDELRCCGGQQSIDDWRFDALVGAQVKHTGGGIRHKRQRGKKLDPEEV